MSIEDILVKLIAAVNDCTAAIRASTAASGSLQRTERIAGRAAAITGGEPDKDPSEYYRGDVLKHATGRAGPYTGNIQTPEAAATPLADIPPATYEEVAKLFAAVYANGANKDDALAAIAPLPHLKDIKANGEQHPGQLAALKGKLLAAAQKVGALV